MKSICLFFNVHQPVQLRKFRFFDIGNSDYYYDDYSNDLTIQRLAESCYLPANKLILELIQKHQGRFKVSFSISGTALDQFKIYAPEVIDSFRKLADTGCVEFLAETYSHSFAVLKNKKEFIRQVNLHAAEIETLFGKKPTAFANTNLIYSDKIGALLSEMGYQTILTESPNHIQTWKNPNYLYHNAIHSSCQVLLKNDMLSDDISRRFSDSDWSGYPLTAKKYVSWLSKIPEKEKIVNLFMDYKTFGEGQKSEPGIFDFLKSFPIAVFKKSDYQFQTPTEIASLHPSIPGLNVSRPDSKSGEGINLYDWFGNELQKEAFENVYQLSEQIEKCTNAELLKDWQYLQTSDHFYYMGNKYLSAGNVCRNLTRYESPYEAFINYMNILSDFSIRLNH